MPFCTPSGLNLPHPPTLSMSTPGQAAVFHAPIPHLTASKSEATNHSAISRPCCPSVRSDWNHQSFSKSEANARLSASHLWVVQVDCPPIIGRILLSTLFHHFQTNAHHVVQSGPPRFGCLRMRSENALFNKEESRLEVGVGRDAVVGCGDRSLGVEPFKGSLQTAWHLSDLSKL